MQTFPISNGMKKTYRTIILILPAFLWLYWAGPSIALKSDLPVPLSRQAGIKSSEIVEQSTVQQAVELPASWGDLGARMITAGVIDRAKLEALYAGRGGIICNNKKFF